LQINTVSAATAKVTRVACIQAALPIYSWYQRSDSDGGGNVRKRVLENDIGTMISTGKIR
jgi:hypothetical protein